MPTGYDISMASIGLQCPLRFLQLYCDVIASIAWWCTPVKPCIHNNKQPCTRQDCVNALIILKYNSHHFYVPCIMFLTEAARSTVYDNNKDVSKLRLRD